jgi:hypothetical protein
MMRYKLTRECAVLIGGLLIQFVSYEARKLFAFYDRLMYNCEPCISVSIVPGYGLDDWAIEVRFPAEAKGFFL